MTMRNITFFFIVFLISATISAQESMVKNLKFESIGPAIMSGRVVDLEVNPDNPTEFYVGYASGGLWYTRNNGTSFEPVMDHAETQNIGDIAVDWQNGTIWVGTGEVNSSRSSYAGIGILKSTDKGKTWQNMGLPDSHHISRILLNPKNRDEIVVAVIGHLYTPNKERGIFKSLDGGKTWKHTLFIDEGTGIIDMEMDPNNFNTLYAGAWERERKAWDFKGNGENSGIYKSTDGGDSWTKISTQGSGFPTDSGVGRIGLAVYSDQIVYAIVDNQGKREKEEEKKDEDELVQKDFEKMDKSAFAGLDNKKLDAYLKDNNFPKKYNADKVKKMVASGEILPVEMSNYLKDANADLFDIPVIGAEVYKTVDGGKTWKKTHDTYIDDLYYSYGYYFGRVHVHPKKENEIYIYGVPLLASKDGGKTFKAIDGDNVHADHHDLWINPNADGHLIDGNDGGVNITYDDGKTWIKNNQPEVGQFYAVNVDNQKPYHVYGGLQDNGVWKGPSTYEASTRYQQSGKYPYQSLMGGDGMQVQIDPRGDSILYTGFQFGYYYRINTETGKRKMVKPQHDLGEPPLRFNWQTPILLSHHNKDIFYVGSNKLYRSMNRGDDFEAISEDLTLGGKSGNVPFGTISSIAESPLQFGVLVVGTDDGLVQLSENGGVTWKKISDQLPPNLWVSRVVASSFDKGRIFVALNGYRNDDFKPYLFVSDNLGQTWISISMGLPQSPINVIAEDPSDENVLYVGNDKGVLVSFDKGKNWQNLETGLPKVAVHDLVVQPTAKDLVIGTHGRSIYKMNISDLQKYNSLKSSSMEILTLKDSKASKYWGEKYSAWGEVNEPKMEIPVFSNKETDADVVIKTENGIEVARHPMHFDTGFNYKTYDLSFTESGLKNYVKKNKEQTIKKKENGKYYLPKGKYLLSIGDQQKEFSIK